MKHLDLNLNVLITVTRRALKCDLKCDLICALRCASMRENTPFMFDLLLKIIWNQK